MTQILIEHVSHGCSLQQGSVVEEIVQIQLTDDERRIDVNLESSRFNSGILRADFQENVRILSEQAGGTETLPLMEDGTQKLYLIFGDSEMHKSAAYSVEWQSHCSLPLANVQL